MLLNSCQRLREVLQDVQGNEVKVSWMGYRLPHEGIHLQRLSETDSWNIIGRVIQTLGQTDALYMSQTQQNRLCDCIKSKAKVISLQLETGSISH